MFKRLNFLAALALIGFAWPAQASMIGTQFDIQANIPGLTSGTVNVNGLTVVHPGVEHVLSAGGQSLEVDLTDDLIIVTNVSGLIDSFDGSSFITFLNLNWGATPGEIVGFSVSPNGVAGTFTTSTATSVTLRLNAGGVNVNNWTSGGSFAIALDVAHTPPGITPRIPEPATLALLGLGLAGLGAVRRRGV